MNLPSKLATIVAVGLFVGAAPALAQTPAGHGTPDGMPPANEGVCDGLKGATPGLYGLCVAYCEAQDLDGLDLNDPTTHNKNIPNDRILRNYNKKKKVGDPDMPCIKPVCPCWDQAEIDRIHTRTGTSYNYDQCQDVRYPPYYEWAYTQEYGYDGGNYDIWFNNYAYAFAYDPSGPYAEYGHVCVFHDAEYNYTTGYTKNIYRSLPVTLEEYAGCKQQILDRAAAANVACYKNY